MNDLVDVLILDDSDYVFKILLKRNIEIYDIKNSAFGTIYTLSFSSVNQIPFEYKVINKRGLSKLVCLLKKHLYFFIGIALSIIVITVLSNLVIKINILHNDSDIRELLSDELKKNGIHTFMLRKSYSEIQEIKNNIKKSNKDKIEWLEIIDDGMNYTVRVERREIPSLDKEKKYCDIVSIKDASISNVLVHKGQSNVDVNDYVKKGSVLISGEIKYNEETKAYTCAQADIYGITWYKVNIKMPYDYIDKVYTGVKKTNYSLEYGTTEKIIFKNHFLKFDTKKREILNLWNIKINKRIESEYKLVNKRYDDSDIEKEALIEARKKIRELTGVNASIQDEKVLQTDKYDSIIVMDIFYSIKEPIGKQVEREIPLERTQNDGTS